MVYEYVTQPFVGPLPAQLLERIKRDLLKRHGARVWKHEHEIMLQDMINDFIKIQGGTV
jgi:hypothetical protein